MPSSDSATTANASTERIQQAFSPGNLRELWHRLADLMGAAHGVRSVERWQCLELERAG